jgi:translin
VELSDLAHNLQAELEAKTSARDAALAHCRVAVRASGNAIRALHRHENDNASALIDEARAEIDDAYSVLSDHADMLHAGFVHDAEKELAEALITFSLVTGGQMPTPRGVVLPSSAFLKGMAESVGELRRFVLDLMRRGDLDRCEQLLGVMDDIYYLLVSMDYPDGVTLGLRRLTDVARSIIERTRGDFTTSKIQSSLRDALEAHAATLTAPGDRAAAGETPGELEGA